MNKKHIDIVLPCYLSPSDWKELIIEAFEALSNLLPQWSIQFIMVNDGDPKISQEDFDFLGAKVPGFIGISLEKNMGKGYAVRKGMEISTSDHVIYTDIEFPYTYQSIYKMVKLLGENNIDIVIGQRAIVPENITIPYNRKIISKCLRNFNKLFIHKSITDTQCGLKGMNQKGKEILLNTTTNRYSFDIEFILQAKKESEIVMKPMSIALSTRVAFSNVSLLTLFKESLSLLHILFKNLFSKYERAK
ncbi:glycosyltransferase family 2 protein [uncultured Aquimarina sp.]|uniref:glycosyltransferase family 2 protein n=1 Tax=uncultured Aquimarina sp. TaxID=575652 RepID=UPI0026273FF1|nr:glycosyltransferase family 2 protein [uncultured Aquimarina sp.]